MLLELLEANTHYEKVPPWALNRARLSARTQIMAGVALLSTFNCLYMSALRAASSPAEMNAMLGFLGFLIVSSSICFSLHFWLVFSQTSTPLGVLRRLIPSILNLGALYMIDSGNTLQHHGSYNLLIFCLVTIPLNLFIAGLYVWNRLACRSNGSKNSNRRFWKQFCTFCPLAGLSLYLQILSKTRKLNVGFFGQKIPCSRTEFELGVCGSCQWKETIPWFDLLPFRQNIFVGPMICPSDLSFGAHLEDNMLLIDGCDAAETEIHSFFNDSIIHRSQGPMYSVLPRTENWGLVMKNDSLDRAYNGFQETVLRELEANTFQYLEPTMLNAETEDVIVYCGSRKPKIASRIQPSSKISELDSTVSQASSRKLNVIVLFIDAMSRAHFHRRLPLTKAALEHLSALPTSDSILYEFSRFHAVGMNTAPNTRALWTGQDSSDDLQHNSTSPPIWELFESAGYIAGRADPMCQDWNAYYSPSNFPAQQPHIERRISHEHIAFSCLPSIVPIGKQNSGNFAGPASIKARCFSDTHVGWHILDWCSSFIKTYQGTSPYFLNAAFMEAHEGSGQVLSTLDERLARFLSPTTDAEDIDWNSTAVAILSDHGALMGLNNAFFENGRTEAKNPFAALVMPRWYMEKGNGKKDKKLREAAGELVTAFDFWETLKDMGGIGSTEGQRGRGKILLDEEVGSRSCRDVGIDETFCRCQ